MVNNLWKKTKIFCNNNHEELTEMSLVTRKGNLTYACPHCRNELSLRDFEKMLDHLADLICEADMNFEIANLTNYKWKKKLISFEITEFGDTIKVLLLNRGAFNK